MGIIRSERRRVLISWESRELCLLYLCSCTYLYIVSNQFVRFEMIDVHNVLVHKLNIVSSPNRDIVPLKWTLYRIEIRLLMYKKMCTSHSNVLSKQYK